MVKDEENWRGLQTANVKMRANRDWRSSFKQGPDPFDLAFE